MAGTPDFLTVRNNTWHFARRVPVAFAHLDRRGVIKHSTKVRVAVDRSGRRALRVAEKFNEDLEQFWRSLAEGNDTTQVTAYETARRRAQSLGFAYVEAAPLAALPTEKLLERLETLVSRGVAEDAGSRAAVLGTVKRPVFRVSRLFEEYEIAVQDELKGLSPEQIRIWRNGRLRAVENFVRVIGDKPVNEITPDDALDYVEWWRGRILDDAALPKTGNKDIGQLSRMLKEMSTRRRLNLPDLFKGLRLKGETDRSRRPYDVQFIQDRFLAPGALDSLNEEARLVLHVMIETGLRPSEIVNLQAHAIRFDAPIPHVSILADGRKLKTEDSAREIPLVGVALEALKLRPNGFPRYRDKSSGLSSALNKYLRENGLRPTKEHSVYSLRHSFKDRLIAAEAPDSLIDALMGHKTYKPKYGKGPALDLKMRYLAQIALKPPERL